MENIIKGIRRYYPVSDSSLEMLFSHMKKLELPKKHLLIHGGVSDRHVYFIEKGFCRSYCLRDGEEITIWFSCIRSLIKLLACDEKIDTRRKAPISCCRSTVTLCGLFCGITEL